MKFRAECSLNAARANFIMHAPAMSTETHPRYIENHRKIDYMSGHTGAANACKNESPSYNRNYFLNRYMEITEAAESGGQTLASSIAGTLRTAISNGELAPGSKLRLDELRMMFGVSLSPLREALSRLSAEGFVVTEDQRGYRVAPISRQNLEEVTKLRALAETFALRESIRNGDDEWEGGVVASLYRINKFEKVEAAADKQAWETAHRDLHFRLISACGMPLLLAFSATLHDLNDRYRRLFLIGRPLDKSVRREHNDICSAALERNSDLACNIMREHIERTGANIRKALLRNDPPLKRAA